MRALKKISVVTAAVALLALAGAGAAAGAAAATGARATARTRAAGPGSGCSAVRTPTGWQVVCDNSSGSPGVPGSPGGPGGPGGPGDPGFAIRTTCTLAPPGGMTPPYPAPAGQVWMRTVCTSIGLYGTAAAPGGLVLVPAGSTAAAPGISPQQVLQMVLAELTVPRPAFLTAPPRFRDGLVGMPEWFWITNWHAIRRYLAVGPASATVTAVPERLTFSPGGGLPIVSCRGPGLQYNKKLPASAQHSACSYTYRQSSAQQPGAAYTASVSVTWTATWTTSDGAGGAVNPPLQVHTTFALPVAEGQALVNSPGSNP
jgi:hypothetical protein